MSTRSFPRRKERKHRGKSMRKTETAEWKQCGEREREHCWFRRVCLKLKWSLIDWCLVRPGPAKHNNNRNFCGYELLRPTYSHEALCKLMELGFIKHLISQNTDGLHRLSGIPRDRLSELHGNSFHEKCEKCGARYERPYAVRRSSSAKVPLRICVHCHFDHRTGRLCERKVNKDQSV